MESACSLHSIVQTIHDTVLPLQRRDAETFDMQFEPTSATLAAQVVRFSSDVFAVVKRSGFRQERYRDLAENADRTSVARALANIFLSLRPICGTGAPGMGRTRATRCAVLFNGK